MAPTPSLTRFLPKRPLFRFFPLLVAFVVLLSFFFYPPDHSLSRPHRYPHHFEEANEQTSHPRPHSPSHKSNIGTDLTNPWENRAQSVKDAFVYAWQGYKKHAAGWDELTPVDGGRVNNFNGWGVTLFDALDTMWLMDLRDEFRESLELIAKANFALKDNNYAPFFETIIRYLGGLLSAYALSGEPVLLSRADDLGRMLLPAFDTPSGLPRYAVNTVTGKTRQGWNTNVLWAEALSNQLEYKFLAHLTGRTEYFIKTENIMRLMYNTNITSGLYPTMWNMDTGTPNNAQFSVGAYADSAHEYLLKQYLLTTRSEPQTLQLYLNSVNGVINNLLYITPNRHLLYVTDVTDGITSHKFEHLSCFFPGLLALGIYTLSTSPTTDSSSYTETEKQLHRWAAEGLAETCWLMYHDQNSGLGPDEVRMKDYRFYVQPQERDHHDNPTHGGNFGDVAMKEKEGRWVTQIDKWVQGGRQGGVPPGVPAPGRAFKKEEDPEDRDYSALKAEYLLRPETVETFFYMWKLTGDSKWRERGWSIFEAIEKYTKTEYGFASISGVDWPNPVRKNEMPSFFLAETLKYLYLLFREDDIVPLNEWVFNTEAHPLPIFDWSPWEKREYNITV